MDKFEKLVNQIMAEAEADGEPVTREEAEEMAKMELGAKEIKNYTQSDKPKKERKPREKKIDADKVAIIRTLFECMKDGDYENLTIKNEQKEITFSLHDCEYSLNLVKHRPPKK